VFIVNKEMLIMLVLCLPLASALSIWFLNNWLVTFAYHVGISYWVIVAGSVVAITIVFLATGFQSIRASMIVPTQELKAE